MLPEYIPHRPHLSSEDVSEARRETLLTSGGRFQRQRVQLPRGRWTSWELRKRGRTVTSRNRLQPFRAGPRPFPCTPITVHGAGREPCSSVREETGHEGPSRSTPAALTSPCPRCQAPHRASASTASSLRPSFPSSPLPPSLPPFSFSHPPLRSSSPFPNYHSSPLLSARHLLYFLCVPIKPNIRRFAPLGARPSGLSGLDRTTSSSLSPDHAPFPLQSPRRPPPSDDASPSQAGGTPDQCPVAPHVSAAEPLSVHPSGQANTHTAPNAGAPLQLTLASLGTSRPGHCTSASERHTDRS